MAASTCVSTAAHAIILCNNSKELNGCYPWVWVSVQWVPTLPNPSPYPYGFHTVGICYPWIKPTGTRVFINPQVHCEIAMGPFTQAQSHLSCTCHHLPVATS